MHLLTSSSSSSAVMSRSGNTSLIALLLAERRSFVSSSSLPRTSAVRDPRAAPISVHRNVSIPETCAFYGVEDAISHCRVPRSCRDCLTKPGCVLSSSGFCADVSSYNATEDYRNATFTNSTSVSTTLSSTFLSGSATYCSATDPVCTQCREEFKQLALSRESTKLLGTQFRRGDGGCVCIGLCEVPQARAARVYDVNCSQPLPVVKYQRRLAVFTSTSRDPRAPLVKTRKRKAAEESCTSTAEQDVRGCRRPRSCRECLLKPNCALSGGQCVAMDQYNASLDFRLIARNSTSGTNNFTMGSAQFPSINTTYCAREDHTCAACGDKFRRQSTDINAWDHLMTVSDVCIGSDGCVCLEACESAVWSSAVYDQSCTKLTGNTVNTQTVFTQAALAVIVWVVLLYLYGRYGQEDETASQDEEPLEMLRNMLDDAPPGRLDLFGWRGFFDRLLEKEQQLLRGEDELLSPVTHPVDFFFMASAPDCDEDDSSAPTARDPRALASAPAYRALEDVGEMPGSFEDITAPSAPDFDDEANDWEIKQHIRERRRAIHRSGHQE